MSSTLLPPQAPPDVFVPETRPRHRLPIMLRQAVWLAAAVSRSRSRFPSCSPTPSSLNRDLYYGLYALAVACLRGRLGSRPRFGLAVR